MDFESWATQIGNRFYLGTLLDASKLTAEQLNAAKSDSGKSGITEAEAEQLVAESLREFDEHFDQLKASPFYDIGFSASFSSDKAVYPLPFGVAKAITHVLADTGCGNKMPCDEKLQAIHPDIFAAQAHLFVNLQAPKRLIEDHFKAWLNEALPRYRSQFPRVREAVISNSVLETWAVSRPILPYQDLMLWYRRHGKSKPSNTVMSGWFGLLSGANKDTVEEISDGAKRAFTMTCYCELISLASDQSDASSSPA